MAEKLIDKCCRYIRKGKIDKLQKHIIRNNLKKELLDQVFLATYGNTFEEERYKDLVNLSNFALKLFMSDLREKYGQKLGNRLAQIMFNTPNIGLRNTNLAQLIDLPKKELTEKEENILLSLLDISSSKDTAVGTHITGGDIGETLSKEGIELTGHKFLAVDLSSMEYNKNVRSTLDKNVTFFQNDPIGLIIQLFNAKEYNNYVSEFNDIMIISIPKDDLEENKEEIIIERNKVRYLNPQYIKGFARVGVENGNIEGFYDNPLFVQGQGKKDAKDLSEDDWKEKFEEWYKKSKEPQMEKKKFSIMEFLKSILNKRKALRDEFEDDIMEDDEER